MDEHRRSTALVLLAFLALAAALGLLGAPAAAAQPGDAGVTLDPTKGPPGTKVTVTARCRPGDDRWNVKGLGTTMTGLGLGSAAQRVRTLTVPPSAQPGAVTVTVTCVDVGDPVEQSSGSSADVAATFTVEAAAVDPPEPPALVAAPTSGTAGAAVTLTGSRVPACPNGWSVRLAGTTQTPTLKSSTPEKGVPDRFRVVLRVTVPAAAEVGPGRVELACGEPVTSAAFRVRAAPSAKVTVEVPDIVGMTLDQAAATLTDRKLSLAEGANLDRGAITGQAPAAGTKVAPGTAVAVEQAPAIAVDVAGSITGPGIGWSVVALGVGVVLVRAGRSRAGQAWAREHVRVVGRKG